MQHEPKAVKEVIQLQKAVSLKKVSQVIDNVRVRPTRIAGNRL